VIVAIASGKGGTGKTTVAVNLARVLNDIQLLDCDVEAPNVHLFLNPEIRETVPVTIPIPKVDLDKCDFCGVCKDVCEFHAILVAKDTVLTFPELCHGCGGCSKLCPTEAIEEEDRPTGVVHMGVFENIEVGWGVLNVGEPMAVPVIKKVKSFIDSSHNTIIDAPPGTTCPTIESIRGSDYCILVTEPTPFGLNDLELAVLACKELGVPVGVVLNRAGIGNGRIQEYCRQENIPLIMEIPHERRIAEAYSRGEILVDVFPDLKERFEELARLVGLGVAS